MYYFGALFSCQAPTGSLQAETSKYRLLLHEGVVKLLVPPQGVGFTLETFEREFTDLGTSFVVTASSEGSKVMVLDDEIAVGVRNDNPEQRMTEGELAKFDRNSKMKLRSSHHSGIPELSPPSMSLTKRSLSGNHGFVSPSGLLGPVIVESMRFSLIQVVESDTNWDSSSIPAEVADRS